MRLALVLVLLAAGFALAATGLMGLLSRATGWVIHIKTSQFLAPLVVPTDLGFALIFAGSGLAMLGLGWRLGRKLS